MRTMQLHRTCYGYGFLEVPVIGIWVGVIGRAGVEVPSQVEGEVCDFAGDFWVEG